MWTGSAIGKLLLQERLYGVRVHDGRVVAVGSWPRILDEATCARLRAVLTDPARRPGPPVHSYLLTGLLRCGRCGGRMRSTKPKTGKRAYQCATKPEGCGGVSILADETEHQVVEQVLDAVASPSFLKVPTVDAQAEDLAAAIAADLSQLEELARDWAAKMISRGEWLAARNAIQLALTKLACIWQRTPSPFPRQWRTCLSAGRRSPSISAGRRCVRSSTAWKSDRQPSGAAIASTPRGSPSSGGRSGRASGANSVADQIGHSTPRSRRAPAPPPRNGHLPPGLVAAVEVESSGIELGCDAGPRDLQPDLAVGLPEDGAFAPHLAVAHGEAFSPWPGTRSTARSRIDSPGLDAADWALKHGVGK